MEKIIRFYNQNRRQIYKWIMIIISFLLAIRIMNDYYKERARKVIQEGIENSNLDTVISDNSNTNIDSIIEKDENDTIQYKKSKSDELNKFIEYCKNSKYSEAYEMLADETKEENLYSTEEAFINNFINAFLKNGNEINSETVNQLKSIYILESYQSNILSTGNIGDIQTRYFRIENKKIIIQDCIEEEEIEKKYSNENYFISLRKAKLYKDSVEFKVIVTNNKSNSINIQETYLLTEKNEKCINIDNGNIEIKPYESNTMYLNYRLNYKDVSNVEDIVFMINDTQIKIQL